MSAQKCVVNGCLYTGAAGYSIGRCYCDFHFELFERGPSFKGAADKVTEFAAWWAVRKLKIKLGKIASCVLESDAKKLIEEVRNSSIRFHLSDPTMLDRKEIVNGLGLTVPEPARMYASRVDALLVKFIVDKAVSGQELSEVLSEGREKSDG